MRGYAKSSDGERFVLTFWQKCGTLSAKIRLLDVDKRANAMTSLYSLRSTPSPDEYTILKMTSDYSVESLYALNATTCTCPAGVKPTCRHRKMLPMFLNAPHVDDGWFLDWNTRLWRKPLGEPEYTAERNLREAMLADPTILDNQKVAEVAKAFESETSALVPQPAIQSGPVPFLAAAGPPPAEPKSRVLAGGGGFRKRSFG